MKPGRQYEEQAAAFFRSLGLDASVEATVAGVRGQHQVDVWVTGKAFGLKISWVVECKDWTTQDVPQEKVLALHQIVQDIGADHGFLLCERGFQPGAIQHAQNANITLTSLNELQMKTKAYLTETALARIHTRVATLKREFFDIHRQDAWVCEDYAVPLGRITVLESAMGDAHRAAFPTVYGFGNQGERLQAHCIEELIAAASDVLDEADKFVATWKSSRR